MKTAILKNASRGLAKTKMSVIKHSPELFMVASIVGVVGAMIEVAHATTKLSQITDEASEKLNAIHEAHDNPESLPEGAEYTDKDYRRDLGLVYFQTGLKVTKLYLPSVIIGGLSIACIISGHSILAKRNLALAAAYESVDRAFKSYRDRVAAKYGEQVEKEIRYNLQKKDVETEYVDENGKTKKKKEKVDVFEGNINDYSEHAIIFDEHCDEWEDNAEYNKSFLITLQNAFNDKYRALNKGEFICLNEVFDEIGHPRSKDGQENGWVKGDDQDDGFIDFGIFDLNRPKARDFVNGFEKCLVMDFNCVPLLSKIK